MKSKLRKQTYRLYPNKAQEKALWDTLRLHQKLYNAALEERCSHWKKRRISISCSQQCKALTDVRRDFPEYRAVNAQALQQTLWRLDNAFQIFFKRAKNGEKAGYPRFKSIERFGSWDYTNQTGWKILENGKIRLAEIGSVKMRGTKRIPGKPRTVSVVLRNGRWYASVTFESEIVRHGGKDAIAFDWGLESYATIVNQDGAVFEIANPRWMRKNLAKLKAAQRNLSRKKRGSKRRNKAKQKVGRIHEKIANQRMDFLHQESAKLVKRSGLIATEKLNIKNMVAEGGSYKRGLNREILSAAPGMFLSFLRYKAEEAGVVWIEIPTQEVKPTQTCSRCGRQEKKLLSERTHCCKCGLTMGRDENAARVILNHAMIRIGQELAERGARSLGLAAKREAPPKF